MVSVVSMSCVSRTPSTVVSSNMTPAAGAPTAQQGVTGTSLSAVSNAV